MKRQGRIPARRVMSVTVASQASIGSMVKLIENNRSNALGDVETVDFSWIAGNIIVNRGFWGGRDADCRTGIASEPIRVDTARGERLAVRSEVPESQTRQCFRHT